MSALQRKLWRDLWGMKGQVLAIAVVLACGLGAYIGYGSALDSLRTTQARYYAEFRFADLFASLRRAPEALTEEVAALPGVVEVESRVVGGARLRLPGFSEPIAAQLVSLPEGAQPRLNRLFLSSGRLPAPERNDEVVISEGFAEAHGLAPGATLEAIIEGRAQRLRVVGVGASPEFVYQLRPGDLFPDFRLYAIGWMNRPALEAGFDMEGAFNDLVLRVQPGADQAELIERLDDLLDPYGGLGAHGRDLQLSHRHLSDEMNQIEVLITTAPVIFLGVAAFLLNVVVGRVIRAQREQIALLKAFGYSNWAVGRHYFSLVAVILCIGAGLGAALGVWFGRSLAGLYAEFFRFPWVDAVFAPSTLLIGAAVTAGAVFLGTLSAVRRAVRLPPAEAMRPEAPPLFRRSLIERLGLQRVLDQGSRMIVRHLERTPVKSLLAVVGIGFAVGLMMLGRFGQDSLGYIVDVQFTQAQREDLRVSFVEPVSAEVLYSLRALPGVFHVEPTRTVAVELSAGHRSERLAIQGLPEGGELQRPLDAQQQPIRVPPAGLVLTDYLGELLGVKAGDRVTVRVLEGQRQTLTLPVAGLTHEYLGLSAYMDLAALNTALEEGRAVSGALLAADAAAEDRLYAELAELPQVASVSSRARSIERFYASMGEIVGIFNLLTTLLAGSIAFGVVYNSARIAFAERAWELASLRVLGLHRSEVAYILLGELALLTLLAIPLGFAIGLGLCEYLARNFQSDLYRIPLMIAPRTYGLAAATVLVAALVSALLILRQLNRLDLVSALKARE